MKLILFILILALQGQVDKNLDFHQLEGLWQIKGKDQFEFWQANQGGLKGIGYKIKNQDTVLLETLSIKESDGQIIYTATVPDQNDVQPIPFILNPNLKDTLSFENPNHDFPQKIQYVFLTDSLVSVHVLGANDKGFSFEMEKK